MPKMQQECKWIIHGNSLPLCYHHQIIQKKRKSKGEGRCCHQAVGPFMKIKTTKFNNYDGVIFVHTNDVNS